MSQASDTPGATSPPRKIRWWPAVAILCLCVLAIAWIRLGGGLTHQKQTERTGMALVATLLCLVFWWLAFSRSRWRLRLGGFACFLIVLGSIPAVFRIRGVTGDLVPILEWRWNRSSTFSPPLPARNERGEGRPQSDPATSSAASPTSASPSAPPLSSSTAPRSPLAASDKDVSAYAYPQFFGPRRDGVVEGLKLDRDWKARPPKLVWRHPVGAAWSGFAVAGRRAVTQEQRGERESVVCYDLLDGRTLWTHDDDARYLTTIAGEGPRATPTLHENRVYTQGATGILNCLDIETGKLIWTKNILEDNHASALTWGCSGSPLVVGRLVVVSPGATKGRSLVAYDRESGAFIWGGGDDNTSYSSPYDTTLCGIHQILIVNANGVASHDAGTGKVLWTAARSTANPHVAMPVVLSGDRVVLCSGYGVGGELLKITRDGQGQFTATTEWQSLSMKAKFCNVIQSAGFLYGLDDGILACVEAANGKRRWKDGRYGHGQLMLVGDVLVLTAENGEVALIEATPDEHRELGRFAAFDSKTWNPPALAGDYLLVRNDKEAACFQVPVH